MLMTDEKTDFRYATPEARWQALVTRDPAANGHFFYAVRTTGVFCRPTCASRRPAQANVVFFDSPQAAQAAGFRACKRCRPDRPSADEETRQSILRACAALEQAETCPALRELADAAGLSPFYFQRLFKAQVGVSPRQYFAQQRAGRIRSRLAEGETVTGAIYEAGYGSSAQFYSQSGQILGMKPSVYRQGGKGAHIRYAIQTCSLGYVLVAATQAGICAIEFGGAPADLEERLLGRFPAAHTTGEDAGFDAWVKAVLALVEQPSRSLDLPLDIQGTAFQQRVWQALRQIPPGSQATYRQVAEMIGQPGAARAVAQACASNQLAVAIPCHRVVREGGGLGGYRWGLERKKLLLEREKSSA